MTKQKIPNCKCGNQMRRIYSRDDKGFTAMNYYYCEACNEVYEITLTKKIKKRINVSQENGRLILKRKGV